MDTSSANKRRVLVVGAGGIGCELLKNLVLTNFTEIDVIDLDTIELSNLNRQFLFQKCHVGKPKAIIARESVLRFNPKANITAYHDSIFNTKYGVDYFQQFCIVLSALDNKAARSHVNRLCLAADVPLIESGSSGYLGQVTLIKKGQTECYDCLPKPPAKTFPGCTIRNTPSEPIHCIVWAKHLFNQLFGSEDPDEAVSPDGEDPENMANAGETAAKKSADEEIVARVSTRQWAKNTNYESSKLFNKLFSEDIKYLLSMSKLWEKRKPPTPLDWCASLNDNSLPIHKSDETANRLNGATELSSHKLWTMSECCAKFSESVKNLHKRLLESSDDANQQVLCWDKDDEDAMNFVASAANLRCFIFSIPVKSKFEIKSLAGNIIPAIATTNAMVAGLIVIQALKVINNKMHECKNVYIRDKPTLNKLIVSGELVKPNPKCYVCASKHEVFVRLNVNKFTIKQFETKILKQELNMVQPDVEVDDGTGRIIISSEEGETEDNNEKLLSHFGIGDSSKLKCDDFSQNYELRITINQCEQFDPSNTKEYEIVTDAETLKEMQEKVQQENLEQQRLAAEAAKKRQQHQDEPDIIVEEEVLTVVNGSNNEDKKRTYEKAFADDRSQAESTSTNGECADKRKKFCAENESNPQQNEITESNGANEDSDSINDASDALSDDENMETTNIAAAAAAATTTTAARTFNKPASNLNLMQKRTTDVIEEEDEDDVILDEDENLKSNGAHLRYNESTTSTFDSTDLQQPSALNSILTNAESSTNLLVSCTSSSEESNGNDVIECSEDSYQQQQQQQQQQRQSHQEQQDEESDDDIIELNCDSNIRETNDSSSASNYDYNGFAKQLANANSLSCLENGENKENNSQDSDDCTIIE